MPFPRGSFSGKSLRGLQTTRTYATNASSEGSSGNTRLLQAGLGANLLISGYLVYQITQQETKTTKQQESLDFGMDRIDECLNRIDLRNNETTGYFERVSKKVEALEKLEAAQKKKK